MPAEATPYWIDKDEPNLAAVVGLAHGDGSVLILGFDWFDSDGAGWETVLATAVTQPQAAVTDASVDAGDDAVFVISIDSSFAQPVAIGYQTVDGTATAGLDYTATSGTVVIPAGSTSAEVVVATSTSAAGGDFSLELTEPAFGQLVDSTGVGTIAPATTTTPSTSTPTTPTTEPETTPAPAPAATPTSAQPTFTG